MTTEPQWEQFLTRNVPHASAPVPQWAHMLIAMTGYFHYRLLAELDEIKELIMTSAASTDQLIQAATATLVGNFNTLQASETTLANHLQQIVTDIQSNGNTVSATTLANLQAAATTSGSLSSAIASAVATLDQAVNPPAPAPAPAPGN